MAEVQRSGAGLLDLEKELVCSVCPVPQDYIRRSSKFRVTR